VRLVPIPPRSAAALRGWALTAAAVLVLLAATTSSEPGRGAAAALVVAGVAAAAFALHRRRGGLSAPPALALLERQPLGRDAGLALLAAGGRRLVVGWGSAGVTLLAELPHGDRPVAP
jgi:hypothetical protein